MKKWQVQEAKNKFSALLRSVDHSGPQIITVRGEPSYIVISKKEYTRFKKPKLSFLEFMRSSPLASLKDKQLNLVRNKSTKIRKIDL